MDLLKRKNFNLKAGAGFVEYCTDGYLKGHRIPVCRFKQQSALKRKFVSFLIKHQFTVEDIRSEHYWEKVQAKGWA